MSLSSRTLGDAPYPSRTMAFMVALLHCPRALFSFPRTRSVPRWASCRQGDPCVRWTRGFRWRSRWPQDARLDCSSEGDCRLKAHCGVDYSARHGLTQGGLCDCQAISAWRKTIRMTKPCIFAVETDQPV